MRKSVGVMIAMTGAAVALVTGLAHAPAGAWRGDLIMAAATLVMALYNVWSRPFIGSLEPPGVCHRRNGVRRGVPPGRGRLE